MKKGWVLKNKMTKKLTQISMRNDGFSKGITHKSLTYTSNGKFVKHNIIGNFKNPLESMEQLNNKQGAKWKRI